MEEQLSEDPVRAPDVAAARVASIVKHRDEPAFGLLLQLADQLFADIEFERHLAEGLRGEPALIELWDLWSGDQRWTPSVYIEGTEVGWFDGERRHVKVHPDRAGAVADFVHRLSAWMSRRAVLRPR
ncbi:hypothetical protein E1212_05345 [Jiangella ureilytica]|uniref:Uncharacterized protein n=1 Tax=Jiangella ureilytica TaxID=2530374 RepID=A0A4R4RU48_9ACTN|nr:hypothetical protein [Jiangella ureilytica]TDC53598.1 hypothetical protein E1212_05345 [Jiangella ureilytica]